jgi:hypothetical protein
MKEFIKVIISSIDFKNLKMYWDDYQSVYYKYLELDELDHDDLFTPEVQIFHNLNLFLSEFIFFFLTNFCEYDHNTKNFISNYSNFDEFLNYSFSIIYSGLRNFNNLFEISNRKRRFFQIECEKTEYTMKDFPNHYGVCLIFYLSFFGKLTPVNVLNEKDFVLQTSLLPLCLSKNYYLNNFLCIIFMIVKSENYSEFRFFKNYQKFSFDILENILNLFDDSTSIHSIFKDSKFIQDLIYELTKFEVIDYDLLLRFINYLPVRIYIFIII